MRVYIVSAIDPKDNRSFVAAVCVSEAIAAIAVNTVMENFPDVIANIEEKNVLGMPTSEGIEIVRDLIKDHVNQSWHLEIDQLCDMALASADSPQSSTGSWSNDVDRQGGAFTNEEIYNQNWR